MGEDFNGAVEPMRAIRDLISFCELTFGAVHDGAPEEQAMLERAQAAFTALRKLFGDERPAEDIADAVMIEPAHRAALAYESVAAEVHERPWDALNPFVQKVIVEAYLQGARDALKGGV